MTKTRKSLVMSAMSMMLCVLMLIGTTFAYFTDTVQSGKNTIKAGNLDIELEYFDGTAWNPVTESNMLFDNSALWEPGHTEVAYLRLSNEGDLALKYNLSVKAENEVAGINVAGESFKLSDYIKMGVDENWNGTAKYENRDAARNAVATAENIATYSKTGEMQANAAETQYVNLAVVVFMPEEVGNDANYKTGTTPPHIELGVDVVATQLVNENDAFGNDYDASAPWLGGTANVPDEKDGVITITTAEQLAGFAKSVNSGTSYSGKTIKLGKNIDLNNVAWTPIKGGNGTNFTFDGNGKTIKNLKITGEKGVGLFHYCAGATVKNLTVDKATVSGINQVGVIFGQGMCVTIENCTVKNSTITTTVKNNDDGDKAGAIVGYLTAQPNASISGCNVENCTINGYRDIGGLVGYAQKASVTGNSVKNTTVNCYQKNNYKNYDNDSKYDAGKIIGENDNATANGNSDESVNVYYHNN